MTAIAATLLQVATSDGCVKFVGRDGVECTSSSAPQAGTRWLQFLPKKGALLRVTKVLCCSCLEWYLLSCLDTHLTATASSQQEFHAMSLCFRMVTCNSGVCLMVDCWKACHLQILSPQLQSCMMSLSSFLAAPAAMCKLSACWTAQATVLLQQHLCTLWSFSPFKVPSLASSNVYNVPCHHHVIQPY